MLIQARWCCQRDAREVLREPEAPATPRWNGPAQRAGAFVGYLIFTRLLGIGDDDAFDLGGLLSAIIGVVIVLLVVGAFARRATPGR